MYNYSFNYSFPYFGVTNFHLQNVRNLPNMLWMFARSSKRSSSLFLTEIRQSIMKLQFPVTLSQLHIYVYYQKHLQRLHSPSRRIKQNKYNGSEIEHAFSQVLRTENLQ